MIKLKIKAELGDLNVIDEVDLEVLAGMTPYSRRRAFGTLMEHIYMALTK